MTIEEDHQVDPEKDFVPATDDLIRERIIYVLTIWPKISPSMLQVGIGTALSPKMWRPVFDKLIRDRIVQQTISSSKSPSDRDQTHTTVSLVSKPRKFKCSHCGEISDLEHDGACGVW